MYSVVTSYMAHTATVQQGALLLSWRGARNERPPLAGIAARECNFLAAEARTLPLATVGAIVKPGTDHNTSLGFKLATIHQVQLSSNSK